MSWPAVEGRHYPGAEAGWWYGDMMNHTGTGSTTISRDAGYRSTSSTPVVSFVNVSKTYGSLKAVDGLSLDLRPGGTPAPLGQVPLPGHAARAAQADQREDHDVRLGPVPRGEVRPGGRHAAVRRADARGDGARARDAGDRLPAQARASRRHAQAGRRREVRRPAGGPAVRRPDPAGPVRPGHLRQVRADRAGRADHRHGRGDPADVLEQHEGRGRRGTHAAV